MKGKEFKELPDARQFTPLRTPLKSARLVPLIRPRSSGSLKD